MSLISAHLEQISMSCQGIDSLPFPPPKIFTNALLKNDDITSLIRDTEAHERALFSVPPPPPPQQQQQQQQQQQHHSDPPGDGTAVDEKSSGGRRHTIFNVAGGEVTTGPPTGRGAGLPTGRGAGLPTGARRNTAVAAVLGGDLHGQILRGTATSSRGSDNKAGAGGFGGEVDIEVLLRGAEKLCRVYPLPGALERVPALRQRYAHQCNTLAYYEARVAEQALKLGRMNRGRYGEGYDDGDDDGREGGGGEVEGDQAEGAADDGGSGMTEEDLRREEEEVRELDRKKKDLQERLRAMDKDLGGLLNM